MTCPDPWKDKYRSKGEATEHMTRVVKRRGASGKHLNVKRSVPLKPYECRCGSWHLAGKGRRM